VIWTPGIAAVALTVMGKVDMKTDISVVLIDVVAETVTVKLVAEVLQDVGVTVTVGPLPNPLLGGKALVAVLK
jgi:hypothetical protein